MEMLQRERKIVEDRGGEKMPYMWSRRSMYRAQLTHTRNKIGVSAVINERRKEEALRWMREVKKLREVHRRGIESVRESECG